MIDSALPREEALRRFRRGLVPADSLAAVAATRDELVRHFVRALEAGDAAALRSLQLTRSEFAWLFYPTSPQGLPPYDLAPDLMWDLLARQTDRGMAQILRRHGGRPLGYAGYECTGRAGEGENIVWGPCVIRRRIGDTETAARLTGPILERHGRFKFVSYTNDED